MALVKVSLTEIISTDEIASVSANGGGLDIRLKGGSFRHVTDHDSVNWGLWDKLTRLAEGRE